VSDTFLDSSWYFLRYPSTDIETEAFDIERTKKWLPVDQYIGGAEHSVLHLLYSRFVTMVLKDLGYIDFEEPFSNFFAHGLIIKDGAKMSKSKGNVVVPDEYIAKYGADTLRSYLMFIGPYSDGGDFRDTGIEGMNRFLRKVWRLLSASVILNDSEGSRDSSPSPQNDKDRLKMMHKTIQGVTKDISEFGYNTAIAKLMEWYNFLNKQLTINNKQSFTSYEQLTKAETEVYLKLLAPFAPHMTEELWQSVILSEVKDLDSSGKPQNDKQFNSIHLSMWPEFDPNLVQTETIIIPVQINGKRRGEIEVQSSKLQVQSEIEELAKKAVAKQLEGVEIKKTIYVPGRIVNFVI
jgi:leucyl-tRNA synthetase